MIPKIIHYCWFGRNPKPELAQKCIKSWKKYCRGYQIIEWNEDNYDLSKAPLYVRQAYEAKKWAFVTDYVRLQVVYENGGIYMDTDVELKKSLDFLLHYDAYFGFESEKYVNTGVGFGAVKGCSILKELMDDYQDIPFVQEVGSLDLTPCPVRNTEVFLKYGLRQDGSKQLLKGDIMVLSQDYFSPISGGAGLICTKNTVSIHWYSASWMPEEQRKEMEEYTDWIKKKKTMEFLSKAGKRLLGERFYPKMRDFTKKLVADLKGDNNE